MARIAIVGVGAVGGALAGLLQTTGLHQITLCTRRPIDTLTVHTPEGDIYVKARNVTNPANAEPVDWVIVATKTYDAEGAATWFPALCAKGSPVAVFQNGVEHRERFEPYLSADRLLPVIIDVPTERRADGSVHMRGATLMKVEDSQLGKEFAGLFAGAAAETMLVDNFTTAAWWKLCINSVGALNALTLKPAGVLREEAMNRVAMAMVAECAAVGRAEGAHLEDDLPEQVMSRYRLHPADAVNSLLADRLAGRKMEIDARNGAIVRKGEKHGIPTPMNRMAVALLDAI
ncbi:MAG TPA: 2-dehydropantoate 2-reductase [Terracidiphilus sp.]|jgi:2-dehydropantoate 2-reductase|nr:2-dehydropantoate 2-reductase [Terracidiphilus sp.]